MEPLDILIYAAIAAFLAYRLWSVLGQRNEGDDAGAQRQNPFASSKPNAGEDDDVMVIEGRARPAMPSALTQGGHAPDSLAGAIDRIKLADEAFHEKKFLEGAKTAFSGIVACFASGDLSPVQRWLGPAVSGPFGAAIADRKAKGETLENTIDRIVAVDIVDASLRGTIARLTVEFVTYQINLVRDASGTLIDGTPGRAEEVRDVWIFERDVKSTDPNWQLVETRS